MMFPKLKEIEMGKRRERVTRVVDGDTFRTASRKRSVRLANVDAPEKGTRGGAAATKALRGLIGGGMVNVGTVGRSYGRAVANVKAEGRSVNAAMRRKLKKR